MNQDRYAKKKLLLAKRLAQWLEWRGVRGLFALLGRLPIEKSSDIAGNIARHIGRNLTRHLSAKENLRLSLPELTEEQAESVLDEMWKNLGRYFGELPHMAGMSAEECRQRTDIIGEEHYRAAVACKRGSLFFSAHMGNWEWGAKTAWALGTPFSIVYRPLNNHYLETLVTSIRNRYQATGIPKNNAGGRALIRLLGEGKPVAILIDQRMRSGQMIPFFGREAPTSTAMAHTALKYGCPIIPTRVERLEDSHFRVTFEPPMETEGKTPEAITRETHGILERWISERPEQWFWVHRRWQR